jgi:hypothetical protein
MCVISSIIPSFILVFAMEEEERDGKHFITDYNTDQLQKKL